VAELYARVALPGNADAVAGLTADARAQALIEQAKKAPAEQAPALEEQAREQQRQAGLAYERAAGKVAAGPGQENWLWNSAQRFLQAQQTAKAQELLLRYTQLEGVAAAERIAEAWYRLASTYGELKQYAAARKAYEHCLKPGNPYFLRARHGLAKIDIAEGQFDAAEQALQENLKALREASQPDAELQERTLYELATVAYTRQDSVKEPLREYGTASERLLGALQQYPDSPVAARARITLAICYWNEALIKDKALEASRTGGTTSLTDEERKTYRRQRNEFLQKALEQCETLEEQLRSRQNNGGRLSPEEAAYYKQAMFWGADCYCYLGRFDQALSRYGALALRYQRKPEELIALSQIRQCYVHMNMPDKVAGVVERLREALNNIPDAAFDGSLPTHRRQYWVDWLQRATQPAIPPAESAPEK
jgi:hypothetical protein